MNEDKKVYNSKPYRALKRRINSYVLAGDYKDCFIMLGSSSGLYNGKEINSIYLDLAHEAQVRRVRYKKPSDFVEINKETIESWELVTEDSQTSLSSSLLGGLVGGALLGPLGLVVGATTGNEIKQYNIEVSWKDGKKSLFLLTDTGYKEFLKIMF
jgi:hypothetical protein